MIMRARVPSVHASPLMQVRRSARAKIQEMQMLIGEIDGVQLYGCDKCGATAFAMKRHIEPKIEHEGDCGKEAAAGGGGGGGGGVLVVKESRIVLDKLMPPDASEQ